MNRLGLPSFLFSSSLPGDRALKKSGPQIWLVVQWLSGLSMQGTQVPPLLQEDSTCCRATKPVCYNC